jgi:hypothetical protein
MHASDNSKLKKPNQMSIRATSSTPLRVDIFLIVRSLKLGISSHSGGPMESCKNPRTRRDPDGTYSAARSVSEKVWDNTFDNTTVLQRANPAKVLSS